MFMGPPNWAAISACVAIDLSQSICAEVARQALSVPFLCVGFDAGLWANPDMWLRPPFASFQVLDRLEWMFQAFVPHVVADDSAPSQVRQ